MLTWRQMIVPHMLLVLLVATSACAASQLLTVAPASTAIVHNSPSAISHQSFTRIHNDNSINSISSSAKRIERILTQPLTKVLLESYRPAVAAVHTLETHTPALQTLSHPIAVATAKTPIVETLTRTPAHLTYAAKPIVYQMLPQIKPVQSISYDSLLPSPRHYTLHKR